jgi:hypothetical protein
VRLVVFVVGGDEGLHLSPTDVLERLTQGFAELGDVQGFAGQIAVMVAVPADRAEQIEEAAARGGLEIGRTGEEREVDDADLEPPES